MFLIASMDIDGSDVTPGCRGTRHLPSQHVAFSPMSEDERLSSVSTIPPDFSPPPRTCDAGPMVACMHSGGVPAYHQAPAQDAPLVDTGHQHRTYHSPQPDVAFLDSISPPGDRRMLFASMDVDEPRPGPHPHVASLDGSCPTAPQVLIASMDTTTTHPSPQPLGMQVRIRTNLLEFEFAPNSHEFVDHSELEFATSNSNPP